MSCGRARPAQTARADARPARCWGTSDYMRANKVTSLRNILSLNPRADPVRETVKTCGLDPVSVSGANVDLRETFKWLEKNDIPPRTELASAGGRGISTRSAHAAPSAARAVFRERPDTEPVNGLPRDT
ncbi:hypothetical protein EVAR_40940_1 [Eumeta japonica]|uniref:Uncharacterized protein n=1 Tax=Eumeta variegata TaxID=151549 RepID=A0A4C1X3T1_EUMVA|nr:hypothetical protein EVAR_40940_1 [Eumeta japonica]